jgi:hypothetical protein
MVRSSTYTGRVQTMGVQSGHPQGALKELVKDKLKESRHKRRKSSEK